jgi:predicted metal-dependent hydrolase
LRVQKTLMTDPSRTQRTAQLDAHGGAFDYQLRVSARARYVRLYVSPHRGLEIVVPRGFDRRRVPEVLREKARWIKRSLERVRAQRDEILSAPKWQLPERIQFRAVDIEWTVVPRLGPGPRLTASTPSPRELEISGPIDNEALGRAVLGRFLLIQAETHLPPLLDAVSRETGLPYARVSIRRQRSRWGSCSAQAAISLNATLMFLPAHLTRYVLVHELCHTAHLNHSQRYWALVARHCPEYRGAEREMRNAREYVPRWALAVERVEAIT